MQSRRIKSNRSDSTPMPSPFPFRSCTARGCILYASADSVSASASPLCGVPPGRRRETKKPAANGIPVRHEGTLPVRQTDVPKCEAHACQPSWGAVFWLAGRSPVRGLPERTPWHARGWHSGHSGATATDSYRLPALHDAGLFSFPRVSSYPCTTTHQREPMPIISNHTDVAMVFFAFCTARAFMNTESIPKRAKKNVYYVCESSS